MAHGDEWTDASRATRVRLLGTVHALVQLRSGERVRAKLQQLSTSGGVLHISEPLDQSMQVELLFHVGSTTVRNRAELLRPIWATKGYLQPFRFTDLSEGDRSALENDLAGFLQAASNRSSHSS
jgi:hypothetical protein